MLSFFSQQFAENMFIVLNFLDNKIIRTPFSKSLNQNTPIWDFSAKVDLLNPKN